MISKSDEFPSKQEITRAISEIESLESNSIIELVHELANGLIKLLDTIHPHELSFANNAPIKAIRALNHIREKWMCMHGSCRHLEDHADMYFEIDALKDRIWNDHEGRCWMQDKEHPTLLSRACDICSSLWDWKTGKEMEPSA